MSGYSGRVFCLSRPLSIEDQGHPHGYLTRLLNDEVNGATTAVSFRGMLQPTEAASRSRCRTELCGAVRKSMLCLQGKESMVNGSET